MFVMLFQIIVCFACQQQCWASYSEMAISFLLLISPYRSNTFSEHIALYLNYYVLLLVTLLYYFLLLLQPNRPRAVLGC